MRNEMTSKVLWGPFQPKPFHDAATQMHGEVNSPARGEQRLQGAGSDPARQQNPLSGSPSGGANRFKPGFHHDLQGGISI